MTATNNVPKVSILMPVCKTAPYLREAVDSILAQTYSNFELIVLNDCSPDNAEEILDRYADPRIVRYRGEKNVGLANVLNIGLEMVRGEYVCRMDSDDISLPNRIERQIDYLEEHPDIDLCSCGMQLFGSKEGLWTRTNNPEQVKIEALFYSPVLHASSIWRKASFERYELHFRQEMVPAEDYDLWCRALTHGLRLVNIDECLYQYRIRPDQATEDTLSTQQKEREVKETFLHHIFPQATESDTKQMARLTHCTSWQEMKHTIDTIVKANCHDPFFDHALLKKQLKKYLHAYNTLQLQQHFTLRGFFRLSLKTQCKWIGTKLCSRSNFINPLHRDRSI